jgi:hypothetical protein
MTLRAWRRRRPPATRLAMTARARQHRAHRHCPAPDRQQQGPKRTSSSQQTPNRRPRRTSEAQAGRPATR